MLGDHIIAPRAAPFEPMTWRAAGRGGAARVDRHEVAALDANIADRLLAGRAVAT